MNLPERFADVHELEEVMSRPSHALVRGPGTRARATSWCWAWAARWGRRWRAWPSAPCPGRRVIGVARFSQPGLRGELRGGTASNASRPTCFRARRWRACPTRPTSSSWPGRKFGSTGSEWLTWAMNAHVPALVAERFARSRIVAFSTACVYPFVSTAGNGAAEDVPPTAPSGEYANSCVARERMFQHFSHQYQHTRAGCCACRMRSTCATACCTTWRARCCSANRSTWRWAMPTSSGRARPTSGRCARWRTATRRRRR